MKRKINIIGLTLFFTLTLFSFVFSEESMTITTYYPSPYGSYNELYVANRLGIGTASPSARLTLRGVAPTATDWLRLENTAGFYRNIYMGGGDDVYFASADDTASLSSTGVWTNASDRASKKDIRDMTRYGLKTVMAMRPVEYRMKSNDLEQIGFIAQEMREIVPEVVSGEEGKMGLAHGHLTAVLVKAIQEQQKQIEDLKSANQEIKSKLAIIEARAR